MSDHGTYSRYVCGCRCEACRQARRDYETRRRHRAPTLSRETAPTADARRSRRPHTTRAQTIRLGVREVDRGRALYPDTGERRPATRAGCAEVPRPCSFVSCPYHLYLDVSPRTHSLKLNFPDLEPDELAESCVLDVADRGGATEDAIAAAMNITRARVQQIEARALITLGRRHPDMLRALAS